MFWNMFRQSQLAWHWPHRFHATHMGGFGGKRKIRTQPWSQQSSQSRSAALTDSATWPGASWGILGHNAQTPFLQTSPAQCPFPASCGVWTLIDIRCYWQPIGRKIEKSVWLCLVIAASVCKRPERLMACCTQRCCQGRVAADCFVRLHSLSATQSLHVTWFENVRKYWTIVWLVLQNSDSLSQNPSRVFKWTAKWKHCWKSVKACGSLPW